MSTNNHVTLTSKDGTEHWKLAFTTNAMCAYEDETQKPFTSVAEALDQDAEEGRLSMRVLRTILWAGLIEYQEDCTQREAGRVLDACGVHVVGRQIGAAIRLAFPEAKAGKGQGKAASGNGRAAEAAAQTGPS